MNEKLIERKLREEVRRRGGLALKFASPYHRGVPDRIVLMPGGRVAFAEIKTTGMRPTPLQEVAIEKLRQLGFVAVVVDSQKGLDEFMGLL